MSLKRIALRDFVIVRELELDLSRRLHGADRRDRRRQVHPDRRAAAGAGRPRRRRVVREGAAARRHQRRVRHTRHAWRPGWKSRLRHRQPTPCCCAAPSTAAGQEPRLDQRQPGHRRPSCASWASMAGGHPRPARLAEPHAAGRGAWPAGRLRRRQHGGAGPALAAVAPGPKGPGGRTQRPGHTAAASASGWPGRSARWTSWRPAPTNGTS
jgi:hypothetical protein